MVTKGGQLLSPSLQPRELEEVASGRASRRPPAHRPVLPGTAPALRRRRACARWVARVRGDTGTQQRRRGGACGAGTRAAARTVGMASLRRSTA